MATFWEWIKRVSALVGAATFVILVFDFLGILPGYEIKYKKKVEITPTTSLFPGARVRLTAELARPVPQSSFQTVVWTLEESSGRKYSDLALLPQVDVQLLPDYAGIINVNVTAKVYGETAVAPLV